MWKKLRRWIGKQVFGKLEKILATVKLQPGVVPETQTAPVPELRLKAIGRCYQLRLNTSTSHGTCERPQPNF